MGEKKSVTFTGAPNFTAAKCCGNCAHWQWGYEGEGACAKYPAWVSTEAGSRQIWEGAHSGGLCDDFTTPQPAKGEE